jgi:putative oxidoreductase
MNPSASTTNLMSFVSRALVALLFIQYGIGKITGFSGTVAYIASANVPLPQVAAGIAILVEVGLGVLLLIGYRTRWVALAMFFYVLVLPFIFHAYWSAPAAKLTIEKLMFYKDLAIAGALLAFATWGAGGWSVDGMRTRAPAGRAVGAA